MGTGTTGATPGLGPERPSRRERAAREVLVLLRYRKRTFCSREATRQCAGREARRGAGDGSGAAAAAAEAVVRSISSRSGSAGERAEQRARSSIERAREELEGAGARGRPVSPCACCCSSCGAIASRRGRSALSSAAAAAAAGVFRAGRRCYDVPVGGEPEFSLQETRAAGAEEVCVGGGGGGGLRMVVLRGGLGKFRCGSRRPSHTVSSLVSSSSS